MPPGHKGVHSILCCMVYWSDMLSHIQMRCMAHAGRYRVTATARKLVALIHSTAAEAARCGSPALAQALVAAIADVAELAGTLPPAVRARELQVHDAPLYLLL